MIYVRCVNRGRGGGGGCCGGVSDASGCQIFVFLVARMCNMCTLWVTEFTCTRKKRQWVGVNNTNSTLLTGICVFHLHIFKYQIDFIPLHIYTCMRILFWGRITFQSDRTPPISNVSQDYICFKRIFTVYLERLHMQRQLFNVIYERMVIFRMRICFIFFWFNSSKREISNGFCWFNQE